MIDVKEKELNLEVIAIESQDISAPTNCERSTFFETLFINVIKVKQEEKIYNQTNVILISRPIVGIFYNWISFCSYIMK